MAGRGARSAGRAVVLAAAIFAPAVAAAWPSRPAAHPMHTTLAELTYDAAARRVEISLRVFAEDFGAAVARRSRGAGAPPDAASYAYVSATLALADRGGRALRLEWCGARRSGDVLWLCLRAAAPQGLGGLRLVNRCLVEMFADQVNIVQARSGARRYSLLFTRGDTVKTLPP